MWTKLDDHFYDHPKIDGLSLAAVGLFCKALTYCGTHLTDGEVPIRWLNRQVTEADKGVVIELVQAGLWESDEAEDLYRVHDYLDWQPSRAYVLGNRSKRQAAGRKGGKASGQVRAAQSRNEASASQTVEPRPVPSRPVQSKEGSRSSPPSLLSEDPVVHTVVARFEEAATDNPNLEVVPLKIARVLAEFPGMSGLQQEAVHCAEWLGAQNGRKRRVGHLTLRNWLKKLNVKEAAPRERRYTNPEARST